MKRLTPAMQRRLIPFLPKLIRHWRKVMRTIHNPQLCESFCPLCEVSIGRKAERPSDHDCTKCPVWGNIADREDHRSCEEYMPARYWRNRESAQRVLDFLIRLKAKADAGEVPS